MFEVQTVTGRGILDPQIKVRAVPCTQLTFCLVAIQRNILKLWESKIFINTAYLNSSEQTYINSSVTYHM